MTANEVNQYVGMPYAVAGFGPYEYNCWGLLMHVQKRHFGVDLPLVNVHDKGEALASARALLQSGEWLQVSNPQHGDAVLLRDGDAHVGIYLDLDNGGVLHSLEGVGVVFTYRLHLGRQGFVRPKYYRHYAR